MGTSAAVAAPTLAGSSQPAAAPWPAGGTGGRLLSRGLWVTPGASVFPAPPSLVFAAAPAACGLSTSAACRGAPADGGLAAAGGGDAAATAAADAEVWPPPPPPRNDLGVDWGGRGIDMSTFGLFERVAPLEEAAEPPAAPAAAAANAPAAGVDTDDAVTLPVPKLLANNDRPPLAEVLGVHGPRRLWAGDASAGNGLLTVVSESDVSVVEAGGGGGGIFAVMAVGGSQVKVTADDVFYAERLPGAVNSPVIMTCALLVATVQWSVIGRPTVPGVRVHCVVEEQTRSRKTVTIKFKRRKGYRRTLGHRQHITRLRVVRIEYQLPPVEEWTKLKVRDAGVALPPLEKRTFPY